MFLRWVITVYTLRKRSAAISFVVLPNAISFNISHSVTVSDEPRFSFFSSLAKLFVIQKEENGRMKLWMDGQPKMNAGFRSEKRPKAVVVNGKVTPVVYEKGTVKVSGVVIE